MDWEILAYLGAALMVVLALAAYRYWKSTASYALRMRESHARRLQQKADSSDPTPPDQAGDGSPEDDVLDQDDPVAAEEPGTTPDPGVPAGTPVEEPPADGVAAAADMSPSAGSIGRVPDRVENPEPAPDEAEPPGTEKNAETTHGSADDDPGTSAENPGDLPEVEDPQFDEHGRNDAPEQIGRVETSTAALVRELDEQMAALPSGIELIDLPILERRRIADRREELLSDRRRLLEHSPRGTHRRRRRSREKD